MSDIDSPVVIHPRRTIDVEPINRSIFSYAVQEFFTVDLINQRKDDNQIDKILSNSGYPSDCFFEVEDYLVCGICQDIVRDPLNLNCSHLFCRRCILKSTTSCCPLCRASYEGKILESIVVINQLIRNKRIKCFYYNDGCDWTGTIGTDERNLLDHLKTCEVGGYKHCSLCSKLVCSIGEHDKVCLERDTECGYCKEKMKKKELFVHEAIGRTNDGRYCENSYKCLYDGCLTVLRKEEIQDHIDNECVERLVVCYACEHIHILPFFLFKEHISDKLKTNEDVIRFMSRLNGPPTGHIGSLVDLYYRGKWMIGEVIDTKINSSAAISVCCRVLNSRRRNDAVWVGIMYIHKLGTHTSQGVEYRMEEKMKDNIVKCLKRFECTSSETSDNIYEIQPFFYCKTCSGNQNREGIGCCAVCAVECHKDHEIVYSGGLVRAFCDCGSNQMKDSRGRVFKCCAPKTLFDKKTVVSLSDLVDIDVRVRPNLEVILSIDANQYLEIEEDEMLI